MKNGFLIRLVCFICVPKCGNNLPCKIVGIRTIRIRMFDRAIRILIEVRHIPKLNRNLISLSTLDSKGFQGKQRLSCYHKGHKTFTQFYILQGSTIIGDTAVTTSSLADEEVTKTLAYE